MALIRIYDLELNAQDASDISTDPFEGVAGSCAIPENNDCVATYNVDGTLNIPCVKVPDGTGGTVMFQVDMKLIPFSTPFSFELTGAQQK